MGLSPTTVQRALRGAEYPASKSELLDLAEENGADQDVLEALREADEEEFDGPADVMAALRGQLGDDEDHEDDDDE